MNITYALPGRSALNLLSRLALALCLGALSACTTVQHVEKVEHGFAVKNVGNEIVRRVVIRYGAEKVSFCDPHCLPGRGGGGWSAPMPIEDYMDVSWITADGQNLSVRVPVKEKIKDLSRFRRLFLEIKSTELVVKQGAYFSNPGLVGWEESPLYP